MQRVARSVDERHPARAAAWCCYLLPSTFHFLHAENVPMTPRRYDIDTWACPACDARILPGLYKQLYDTIETNPRCGSCPAPLSDYVFVHRNKTPRVLPVSTSLEGASMQCQLVSLDGVCDRLVPSVADGRTMRDLMMEEYGVPKKAITITPEEVPTNKVDLLDYINKVLARVDGTPRPK
jgi:hypothetical protein